MKGSFLNWFVGLVEPEQAISVLPWLSSRSTTKYFFPHRRLYQFLWPHRPASWAVGRQPCLVVCCLLVCASGSKIQSLSVLQVFWRGIKPTITLSSLKILSTVEHLNNSSYWTLIVPGLSAMRND
jgi:hypothetical protein